MKLSIINTNLYPLVSVFVCLLASLHTSASIIAEDVAIDWEAPKSDKQEILDSFNKFFTKPRAHTDQKQKEFVREGVIMRLKELGFESSFLQKTRADSKQQRRIISYNMVSILPGKHRRTKRERILLIGAHWDSVARAPVSIVAQYWLLLRNNYT